MGSQSQSLLFFIVDTSYSCVICSKFFWILCYEYCTCITKVLVDWPLNSKIVNRFEDVQYKMCYKDFKYNIYRVSQEKCARLWEGVPYVKVYWYNPKHLCPKLNGYSEVWNFDSCYTLIDYQTHIKTGRNMWFL